MNNCDSVLTEPSNATNIITTTTNVITTTNTTTLSKGRPLPRDVWVTLIGTHLDVVDVIELSKVNHWGHAIAHDITTHQGYARIANPNTLGQVARFWPNLKVALRLEMCCVSVDCDVSCGGGGGGGGGIEESITTGALSTSISTTSTSTSTNKTNVRDGESELEYDDLPNENDSNDATTNINNHDLHMNTTNINNHDLHMNTTNINNHDLHMNTTNNNNHDLHMNTTNINNHDLHMNTTNNNSNTKNSNVNKVEFELSLSECVQVASWSFWQCSVSSFDFVLSSRLEQLTINFPRPKLSHCAVASLLSLLGTANRLMSLTLADCIEKHDDVAWLELALHHLPQLPHLDLYCNHLGPERMKRLSSALGAMRHLTELDLTWNNLRAEGISHLAPALQNMTHLAQLKLSHNSIGEEGISLLAPALSSMLDLTKLSLQNNAIGTLGVQCLLPCLLELRKLAVLDISRNGTDSEIIVEIREHLSHVGELDV